MNSRVFSRIILSQIFSLILILCTCSEKGVNNPIDNPDRHNQRPRIISVSISPSSLPMGQQAALSCNADDADGDELTYRWTAVAGSFPAGNQSKATKWQAPDIPGEHRIKITVRDADDSVYQEIALTVLAYHSATISGQITTGFDNPVAGANVCFGPYCTKSSINGNYRFLSIPSGTYSVNVSLNGYESVSGSVEIYPGSNAIDFSLVPVRK